MQPRPPMACRATMPPPPRSAGARPADPWRRARPGQAGRLGVAAGQGVLPLLGGTTLALGMAGLLAGALLLG